MGNPDIKLLMVTDANNNKFYYMHDNENGTFSATWGRYGTSGKVTTYEMAEGNKTILDEISLLQQATNVMKDCVSEMFCIFCW